MKYPKWLFFLILVVFSPIFTVERGIEPFLFIDPVSPLSSSRIDIYGYISCDIANSKFLVSPRLGAHFNGQADVGLGVGMRHAIGKNILGYHAFWEFSSLKRAYFHQVGPSFEFLTPLFDLRANYYHPVIVQPYKEGWIYTPQRWAESEITFKGRFFNFSTGPLYNFTKKSLGAKIVVSVPCQNFTIGTGVYFERDSSPYSFVSIGVPLYTVKGQTVGRCSHVKSVKRRDAFIPNSIVAVPHEVLNEQALEYLEAVDVVEILEDRFEEIFVEEVQQQEDVSDIFELYEEANVKRWPSRYISRAEPGDVIRPGEGYRWGWKGWHYESTGGGWAWGDDGKMFWNPAIEEIDHNPEIEGE